MKPTVLCGIDPGKSGGLACIWPDSSVTAQTMPQDDDMRDVIAELANGLDFTPVVYLEQVQGFIGKQQPGSHMFVFGSGYGFIRGLLAANRIKTILVRPQTWQKNIPGVFGKGPERKRALKDQAARLFPNLKVTLSTADALLIADYGRRQELAVGTT